MAASGSAVTVLTPNGRRQAVKVSPNTPLLQVLEDVCQKHGFDPGDYGLKFQRTVLDLTLPWRFAKLPNNAKLEMVMSTKKQVGADNQVRVALQMEDGSRLQGSFSSGQSLWELVTHFPQIRCSVLLQHSCVCVYHAEVPGSDRRKHKTAGEEDDTAAVPLTLVAKETTASSSPPSDAAPLFSEPKLEPMPAENSVPDQPMETSPVPTPAMATSKTPVHQEAVQPKAPPTGSEIPFEDGEEAGPSGLDSHPSSSSPASPSAPFIPFSGGGQRLGDPEEGAIARSLSSSSSSPLSALTVESPKAKKAKSSHSSSTKVSFSPTKPTEYESTSPRPPIEREPLIYHLDSSSRHTEVNQDLPDEFFEVTVDDVRKRFAQLKSERWKSLEETPLMTKSMRETRMKEKIERYPKVVLRVQFPDRHVLQGFFRPLETGVCLCFVRSHLEDPRVSFYLCKCSVLLKFLPSIALQVSNTSAPIRFTLMLPLFPLCFIFNFIILHSTNKSTSKGSKR
uniref:ASPSCR1 tether for SLC2A4, UBX domain containing n=1 Tax=Nothobranchius furzeri TaxID=105023 RepID=A0A8C6KBQ3_NOTFU